MHVPWPGAVDLAVSADGLQSLVDPEQTQMHALGLVGFVGGIEALAFIGNGKAGLIPYARQGQTRAVRVGVLDHVQQQLAGGLKQQHLHALILGFGLFVGFHVHLQAIQFVLTWRQPAQRWGQPRVVEDLRAQLRGQRGELWIASSSNRSIWPAPANCGSASSWPLSKLSRIFTATSNC